jgi:hypothetical protein
MLAKICKLNSPHFSTRNIFGPRCNCLYFQNSKDEAPLKSGILDDITINAIKTKLALVRAKFAEIKLKEPKPVITPEMHVSDMRWLS